jgi:purine nucleosidase
MSKLNFPTISEAKRKELLEPPQGPVRVVIDTDTANEIDDQFALAWALLSQDTLRIEGVYAVPYSFGIYRTNLLEAHRLTEAGEALPERLQVFTGWLKGLEKMGKHPREVPFCTPAEGMEESYQEIVRVYEKLRMDSTGLVFRGSERYLTSYDEPVKSPAAEHLIERALADSDEPLYVIAIGCLTNVASALLMAPEIASRIVVTWTAGYPSNTNIFNHSFNMEQDMLASQLLFESGVPLVYLPGYYLGSQLRLSLPEVERWVKGKGAIGDYLHHLYTHNPIYEQRGIEGHEGRTWIIWDLINIAWLLQSAWVPSHLVATPRLGEDQFWYQEKNAPKMREAYEIDRDSIFRDFFAKLEKAPH